MYSPLNYEQINSIAGQYHPSSVKSYNNRTFLFWERALFQRALSGIDYDVFPEEWNGAVKDLFEYCILTLGFVPVFELPQYGKTFNPGTLSGYDWYYRPTRAIVTNPALPYSLDLEIGKKCAVIKLTPDYRGIREITEYYAEKLSTLDNAINMSLINNKFAFMLGAKNKAAAEALKKMLDLVNSGEPAVIFDRKIMDDPNTKTDPFQIWERGAMKDNYMTTEQLADFRTLLHNFDSEIGIPTLPIEKKERMISSEATALEADSTSRSRIWVECINESAKEADRLFGIKIHAKLSWENLMKDTGKEVSDDGETDSDRII